MQMGLDFWPATSGHVSAGIPPAITGEDTMTTRIQIVGRLPVDLSRRVRATAKKKKVSLNAFLIEVLSRAVERPHRIAKSKETK